MEAPETATAPVGEAVGDGAAVGATGKVAVARGTALGAAGAPTLPHPVSRKALSVTIKKKCLILDL